MLYRKRKTNPRAHRELPMTEMSSAAPNKNNGASGDRNSVYNIQERDHYDYIDEERVGYEALVGGGSAPAYEVLGPEYLRVVG